MLIILYIWIYIKKRS